MKKLSIGGILHGYVNVDAYDDRADVKRLCWDTGLPDDEFDWIEMLHVLEHVSSKKVVPSLKEVRRVLRPGAEGAIMVPDVAPVMIRWANSPTWPPPPVIYGNQEHDGQFHKTAFTKETLLRVLRMAKLDVWSIETLTGGANTGRHTKRTLEYNSFGYEDADPAFIRKTLAIRPGILAHVRKEEP